eukprot:scaffold1192_cov58-Cylindrotheca_fusiformis.AAC.4
MTRNVEAFESCRRKIPTGRNVMASTSATEATSTSTETSSRKAKASNLSFHVSAEDSWVGAILQTIRALTIIDLQQHVQVSSRIEVEEQDIFSIEEAIA